MMKWMAEYNFEGGKAMSVRFFDAYEGFKRWMEKEQPDGTVEVWELGDADADTAKLQHYRFEKICFAE